MLFIWGKCRHTRDLQVMEPAVCLSELIVKEENETVLWEKIRSFIKGFTSIVTLSDEEIASLPILIQLRRLDVFVHFLGRYLDGVEDNKVLHEQILKTAANRNWLQEGGETLKTLWKKL